MKNKMKNIIPVHQIYETDIPVGEYIILGYNIEYFNINKTLCFDEVVVLKNKKGESYKLSTTRFNDKEVWDDEGESYIFRSMFDGYYAIVAKSKGYVLDNWIKNQLSKPEHERTSLFLREDKIVDIINHEHKRVMIYSKEALGEMKKLINTDYYDSYPDQI